jgi:hypothetical protein
MSTFQKLLIRILSGMHDKNIHFNDLRKLLLTLNFDERIKGDHFIYTKKGIEEILNIQPNGNKAKPYQVKQVRNIIVKYKLGGNIDV